MSKKTALVIFVTFSLVAALGGLLWFGGPLFLGGLGGLILGLSHLGAYRLGSAQAERRAERLIKTGAALVRDSVTRNDEQDAAKIKAMAGLLEQAVKVSGRNSGLLLGAGALPPALSVEEGVFEELE